MLFFKRNVKWELGFGHKLIMQLTYYLQYFLFEALGRFISSSALPAQCGIQKDFI